MYSVFYISYFELLLLLTDSPWFRFKLFLRLLALCFVPPSHTGTVLDSPTDTSQQQTMLPFEKKRRRESSKRSKGSISRRAAGPANAGIVARVTSMAKMEAAARIADTKGVVMDRGPHPLEREMEQWVSQQEETYEFFSKEQMSVSTASDANKLRESCARLVAEIPGGFQESMRSDAEALAAALVRMCPDSKWLTLQVEIVGANSCARWHQVISGDSRHY
jgi:hypothetical protein